MLAERQYRKATPINPYAIGKAPVARHNADMEHKHRKTSWLRGYRCHTLWDERTRVDRIDLVRSGDDLIYLCKVGTRAREERGLAAAKRWVEEQAAMDKAQLALF